MILHNYIVWKDNKATPISKIQVGDSIAVLADDLSVQSAIVKSIIPVHSSCSSIQLTTGQSLVLSTISAVLTDSGYLLPTKGDLLVCGKDLHRAVSVKESLTLKRFYDIMIDVDLPVIIQDGYCIKVKVKR